MCQPDRVWRRELQVGQCARRAQIARGSPSLVDHHVGRVEAEIDEQPPEEVRLVAAELQQQPATRPEPADAPGRHLDQQVGAVLAAVERESWLERLHVARQQPDGVGRHVRHDGGHHVDVVCERARQWLVEPALEDLDAVAPRTSSGDGVELGRDHRSCRACCGQHRRDRAGTAAEIHSGARRGHQRGRAARERLGVRSRHVDARLDDELEAAERGGARHPGQRLTGGAAGDQRVESDGFAGRGPDELVGFLRGGDAARSLEPRDDRAAVEVRHATPSDGCDGPSVPSDTPVASPR